MNNGRGAEPSDTYKCFGGKIPDGKNMRGACYWMNKEGANGTPILEFDSTGRDDWKHAYVTRLTGEDLAGNPVDFHWEKKWVEKPNGDGTFKISGDHLFYFYPCCERLMFAQNIVNRGGGTIMTSGSRVEWFTPTLCTNFSSPYVRNDITDSRPYMAPTKSVHDWNHGEPYRSMIRASQAYAGYAIVNGNETWGVWGSSDWRYNPKAVDEDYYMTQDELDKLDPNKYGKRPAVTLLALAMDGPLKEPGEMLFDWILGNGQWGCSVDDLVMLYAMAGTAGRWMPICWTKGYRDKTTGLPYDASTKPGLQWGQPLAEMLEGNVRYGVKDKSDYPGLFLQDDVDLVSFAGDNVAFDLRLHCVRYNWGAKALKKDAHGNMVPNKEQSTIKGYFNTKCYASVRQIVPAPPR